MAEGQNKDHFRAGRVDKTAEADTRKKMAEVEGGNAKIVQPRSRIPKKYASQETSKLSFTVEAGVENQCDFDLTD